LCFSVWHCCVDILSQFILQPEVNLSWIILLLCHVYFSFLIFSFYFCLYSHSVVFIFVKKYTYIYSLNVVFYLETRSRTTVGSFKGILLNIQNVNMFLQICHDFLDFIWTDVTDEKVFKVTGSKLLLSFFPLLCNV